MKHGVEQESTRAGEHESTSSQLPGSPNRVAFAHRIDQFVNRRILQPPGRAISNSLHGAAWFGIELNDFPTRADDNVVRGLAAIVELRDPILTVYAK
jgi:hypothetical protein